MKELGTFVDAAYAVFDPSSIDLSNMKWGKYLWYSVKAIKSKEHVFI